MQEFKVGDRVRLEGVVIGLQPGFVRVQMRDFIAAIPHDVLAHATLIKPAEEEKAEELDLSKPMRCKSDEMAAELLDVTATGKLCIRHPKLGILLADEGELENIPEPKITTSDVLSLCEFKSGDRIFLWGTSACATRISQARVSYTEGEGWTIEEVK